MTTWTPEELDRIGAADELEISTERGDGTVRPWVPIWVVRVGDGLFVRSWRGTGGAWYRHAAAQRIARVRLGDLVRQVAAHPLDVADTATQAAIDDGYRSKYARHGDTYVKPMIADQARVTTLQLAPRD